ncbi:MAG: hypothetical protein LBF95_04150 [Treponema sp.]|jgi:hypothetical protein|nr:hypothetical protein [Treponema sp.]
MNELYVREKDVLSRCASFENPLGEKGKEGRENKGAKGRAYRPVPAGASVVLMDTQQFVALRA